MDSTFIIVLSDGTTWDTDATLVRVTEDQLDEIQSGERVCDIVDLNDGSVSYQLGVEALNMFMTGGE
tara:strand:+ start:498 stop:698 length:201 start_codon:yes stop_codon:yes gene_type:complete